MQRCCATDDEIADCELQIEKRKRSHDNPQSAIANPQFQGRHGGYRDWLVHGTIAAASANEGLGKRHFHAKQVQASIEHSLVGVKPEQILMS